MYLTYDEDHDVFYVCSPKGRRIGGPCRNPIDAWSLFYVLLEELTFKIFNSDHQQVGSDGATLEIAWESVPSLPNNPQPDGYGL